MPKKPLTNIEIQKRLDALERRGMNEGGEIDAFGSTSTSVDMFGRTIGNKDRGQVDLSKTTQTAAPDGTFVRTYFDYDGNQLGGRASEVESLGGTQTKEGEALKEADIDRTPAFENISSTQQQDTNPFSSTYFEQKDRIIVHYVIFNPEGTTTKYYRKEAYEGDPPPEGTVAGPFPDANTAKQALDALVEQMKANEGNDSGSDDGTGGGTGGGTGTGAGALETRFGDVLNQYDQMAGLTGTDPNLPETAKVKPTDMQVQTGELETTAGVQVGATQQAATEIISDAQIQALQAAGYTVKSDADTVASTTNTINDVTNQALTAQTLDTLTKQVDPQTGKPIVGESIIGQAPQRESIDQKQAEGSVAEDMASVDRRKTPTVGDFTGNFNDKIDAASRSITTNEIVQPIGPAEAKQAEDQVMAELRDNATMEAAQSSTDEQTRATANAITQQMSEVPVEATVQGQLTNLMAQFADGKTPAYAAGAIRNAEAQMAARGLSASSMAGAAIMQAAMESSLPIAAQDAQVFKEINLTNINNKQKVALANQAAALQIGLADLNARQQTALQNSTNGFKLQSQSLSNMQQTALANAQLKASLQERELNFEQQRQVVNAARYAEIEGINLNNEQQGIMQDSVNNMQVSMSNMSFKQQRELSKAQIDAALTGQELTNDQQRAVVNAARVAEVNNLTFNEEQARNLNNSQLMQNMTLANLDAEMKTALSNAAAYASMEMASLNNRQQAQVVNAQAFLNMDMSNLTNKQQGEVLKYQAKTQALFTDAAADNARLQFNATSENQTDQFFAQLGSQVAQQNANRVAAMKEFNSDQTNAQARFNSSLVDTREKFNSTMQAQINQSNAAWRRQINTQNTATQNDANRTNALNVLGINQNALNNIWQQYRDESSWLTQSSFNDAQYAHELVKLSLQGDINARLFNQETKAKSWEKVGKGVMTYISKILPG